MLYSYSLLYRISRHRRFPILRRSSVVFCVLFLLVFKASSTFLTASLDSNADGLVPWSLTDEGLYISQPQGLINPPRKYFIAAAVKKNKRWVCLHYDSRYFKFELNKGDRERAIRYMLEAWLAFLEESKIQSWIAHGTLLGWYWNAEPLPWDSDVDVQMFVRTMDSMSERFNGTSYEYTTSENEARNYYLDVNPNFLYRSHEDRENVIDARFLDMQTGLYIDITALAETDPIRHPNTISCKNNHRYLIDDILPLQQKKLIGKHVYVPHKFEKVLQNEYSKTALTNGQYMGYIFSVKDQKWLEEPVFRALNRRKYDIGNGSTPEPVQ
ncbi:LicD family-domain-containing protein [Lipomyces tetrasporus]|uniref:LicD family-domain-containing protein n=1 Tax=Lipomyces tetrasporus TaxID=54092 RepID=A0AAD7VWT1_9ASCO|nr:LicD family-domain-containing protein [Lipomyces tetrasporus]KAJ8104424.1 LicD family-domain-containing protein [Lipomyces tetrasporus]